MKLILVRWKGDITGSRYTIHEAESYSEWDVFTAIDALECPSLANWIELPRWELPKMNWREMRGLKSDGFLDSVRIEDELNTLWEENYCPFFGNEDDAQLQLERESELKKKAEAESAELQSLREEKQDLLLRIAQLNPGDISREEVRFLTGEREQRTRFVYIMKDKANGLYKIGKSVNPRQRESTLQSEKPTISMVFKTEERDGFSEKTLHAKYAGQRKRGEWFHLTPAQVRYICKTGNCIAN